MPQKQKLEFEAKIAIVRRCISGEIGLEAAGREAGVDSASIRRWIAKYEVEGADAFLPQKRNRAYSPELKIKVVEEYLAGSDSILDLCRKYNIRSTSVVKRWIKKYNAHGDFYSVKFSGGGSYMKQGRETTQEERIHLAVVFA